MLLTARQVIRQLSCTDRGDEVQSIKEFVCPDASHIAYNLLYSSQDIYSIMEKLERDGHHAADGYLADYNAHLDADKRINIYDINRIGEYNIYPERVGVDSIGIGVSTLSTFRNLGFAVEAIQASASPYESAIIKDFSTGKPLIKFKNLRSQMYWELRQDFQNGNIRIKLGDGGVEKKIFDKLKRELTSIRFDTQDHALTIEPKSKIKKRVGQSPNISDAFTYWNWMRKGYVKDKDALCGYMPIGTI